MDVPAGEPIYNLFRMLALVRDLGYNFIDPREMDVEVWPAQLVVCSQLKVASTPDRISHYCGPGPVGFDIDVMDLVADPGHRRQT